MSPSAGGIEPPICLLQPFPVTSFGAGETHTFVSTSSHLHPDNQLPVWSKISVVRVTDKSMTWLTLGYLTMTYANFSLWDSSFLGNSGTARVSDGQWE